MTSTAPKPKRPAPIVFRAHPVLMKLLRETAANHGRNPSEEIRIAIELHCTASLLAVIDDPEVQARLGDDAADTEAKLRADLEAMQVRAYTPEPAPEDAATRLARIAAAAGSN